MLQTCKRTSKLTLVLKQCQTLKQLNQVHCQIITGNRLSLHPYLLLSFTSLSPPPPPLHHHYAAAIFNTIKNPSTFCYNTIIRAHSLLSLPFQALQFFARMRCQSILPDTHTFPFVLTASAQIKSLTLSQTLHCQSLKFGFLADVYVVNCLIHLYSVLGLICHSHKVFDESYKRDTVSYNTLIDGFVKVGEIERARELFDQMPRRDSVSWGTIIAGYAKMDQFEEAIKMFENMIDLGFCPDNIALVSVLSACAQLGELEKGKDVHKYILQKDMRIDVYLFTGLVDLYAKCGCIETAMEIFESSPKKALFTWNAMLNGLAMHGHGTLLLNYFSKMVNFGIQPDGVTLLVVLVGCSHAGLVDKARQIFREMEDVYRVPRELKHYGCMADLLGRAGLITEAIEMIENMPIRGDVYVWGGLLNGCRLHGNVEIAEKAASSVVKVKPDDGGVYSVLANVYANTERWDEFEKVRKLRDSALVKKKAGCSLIELDGTTHEFVAGDELHPQSGDIYLVLDGIGKHQLE